MVVVEEVVVKVVVKVVVEVVVVVGSMIVEVISFSVHSQSKIT